MNQWDPKDIDIYVLNRELLEDNILECQIQLSLYCNYNCPYCVFHERKDISAINRKSIIKIIDFLKLQKFNLLRLTLTGGEPTLSPHLDYYIDLFRKNFKNITIRLISNLTAPIDTYLNLDVDSYLMSYHSEFVKTPKTWLKKIEKIKVEGPTDPKNISVALMYHRKNSEYIEQIYNKYRRIMLPINVHLANIHTEVELKFSRNKNIAADEMLRVKRKAKPKEVILKGKYINNDNYFKYRNFKGMVCGTGFVITPKLEVYKCWQTYRSGRYIIDLNTQRPRYIKRWFMCTYNHDCCDGFSFPKYSPKYFSEHYKEITYG
jgi:sulfatase maturation enzyme AslB (radical SAM superfamily)